MSVSLRLTPDPVSIGDALQIEVTLMADVALPVMVDYRIRFHRPNGRSGEKVFKLKTAQLKQGMPMTLTKSHRLKGEASTFKLHPGPHQIIIQINGQDRAEAAVMFV
jgi:hypothetical protein